VKDALSQLLAVSEKLHKIGVAAEAAQSVALNQAVAGLDECWARKFKIGLFGETDRGKSAFWNYVVTGELEAYSPAEPITNEGKGLTALPICGRHTEDKEVIIRSKNGSEEHRQPLPTDPNEAAAVIKSLSTEGDHSSHDVILEVHCRSERLREPNLEIYDLPGYPDHVHDQRATVEKYLSPFVGEGDANPDAVDMILHFVSLSRGTGSTIDIVRLHEMGIFAQQFDSRLSPALVSVVNLGKDARKAATIDDPRVESEKSRSAMVDLFKKTFGTIPATDHHADPVLASLGNREAVVRAVERELQAIVFINGKNDYDTYDHLLECVTNARAALHKEQLRRTCTLLANKCTELKVLSLAARSNFRVHLENLTQEANDIYKKKATMLGGIDAIRGQFEAKCKKVLARLQKEKLAEHSLLASFDVDNDQFRAQVQYIALFINHFNNENFYNTVNWPILMAQKEALTEWKEYIIEEASEDMDELRQTLLVYCDQRLEELDRSMHEKSQRSLLISDWIEREFRAHRKQEENEPGEPSEIVRQFLAKLFKVIIEQWSKRKRNTRSLAGFIAEALHKFGKGKFEEARELELAAEIRPKREKLSKGRKVNVKDAEPLKDSTHLTLFNDLTIIEGYMHRTFKELIEQTESRNVMLRKLDYNYPTPLRCQKTNCDKALRRELFFSSSSAPDIDTRINNHLRLGVVRMNIDQMNSKLVIEWQSKEHQDQVKQRMEPLCTFKMRKREDKEQDNRALSPIFVMTKVRATKGLINRLPNLYMDALRQDVPTGHYVVAVCDRKEEFYYHALFTEPLREKRLLLLSLDDQHEALPINVGRKRQLAKWFSHHMGLLRCWALDDDIEQFYEHDEIGFQVPCTMARALLFAELVLQMELEDKCDMANQDYLKSRGIAKATNTGGYDEYVIFMRDKFTELFYTKKLNGNRAELDRIRIQGLNDPRGVWENSATLKVIEQAVREKEPPEVATGEEKPAQTLDKILSRRKRRIAQVALWSVATPHTKDIINKLWYGPSHEVSKALYQVHPSGPRIGGNDIDCYVFIAGGTLQQRSLRRVRLHDQGAVLHSDPASQPGCRVEEGQVQGATAGARIRPRRCLHCQTARAIRAHGLSCLPIRPEAV